MHGPRPQWRASHGIGSRRPRRPPSTWTTLVGHPVGLSGQETQGVAQALGTPRPPGRMAAGAHGRLRFRYRRRRVRRRPAHCVHTLPLLTRVPGLSHAHARIAILCPSRSLLAPGGARSCRSLGEPRPLTCLVPRPRIPPPPRLALSGCLAFLMFTAFAFPAVFLVIRNQPDESYSLVHAPPSY